VAASAIKWNLEAERELWAAICAPRRWFGESGRPGFTHPRSLYWFIQLCWGTRWYFAKRPGQAQWLQERVHKPYLDWLQIHLEHWMEARNLGSTNQYYLQVILPRGFGKTVTATKSAPLWTHLDDPDMSTLFFSATHPLARDVLESVQKVISGRDKDSWFTWLYGNWYDAQRSWTKESCHHKYRVTVNLSEPSFDTSATDIGATGYHHDQHIVDDPIIKNKLRDGGSYMVGVTAACDALFNALKPNGLMLFVLTRYLDNDVSGKHMKDEGIATWSGMRCPNTVMFDRVAMGDGIWHIYFWQAEAEDGRATLPEVYNEQKIAAHKRRDPEDFACQYQNDPGTGEHAPLLEWQLRDCYMDFNEFNFEVGRHALTASIHIDTAFKRKENVGKGDYSAIVVFLHDTRPNGRLYLDTSLLKASNEWRSQDFNTVLVQQVLIPLRKRGVFIKCITDETEGFGKAGVYEAQLRSLLNMTGFQVKLHVLSRAGTKKRQRIRTAAGTWAEGWVRVLLNKHETVMPDGRKVIEWAEPAVWKMLANQMLRVDSVEHDDLADAAADVFVEDPRIWTRPSRMYLGDAPQEGQLPTGPAMGDRWKENERLFGPDLAGQITESEEAASWMGPGHGPDNDWLPPREPV
jgi:hypothetical protein